MPPTRPILRLGLLALLAAALLAPAPTASAASPAKRMVRLAQAELAKGVREIPDGSNRGARIRLYGGSTTPRLYPAPWCAYFVSWLARRSGAPLGPAGEGFGYVPYIRAWALRTNRWKKAPRSGDLVMFPQHVGLVERVYRNGTLTTIEGNSSNRVARRWRRWRDASGYVRVAAGGTVTAGAPKATDPQRPSTSARAVARISVYPGTTVAVGQEVGFSANDSSGDLVRYAWDLDGDGRFDDAKGDNAERVYATPGTVRIGLKVTDRRGRTATAREVLTVQDNRSPEAVLHVPQEVEVGERFVADASDSHDPDGEIAKFEWDLDGDGRWEEGDEDRTVRLERPGVHAMGLRVTDDRGAVAEKVATVRAVSAPPVAKASAPSRVALNREVGFDASRSASPSGGVLHWEWHFDGDGTPDAGGARPSWRFATPGARDVRVVVVDEWGGRAETTVRVEVVDEAPTPLIGLPPYAIAGDGVTLDGSGSYDSDSRLVRHEWDLDGDGDWDASGARVTFRPDRGGTRRVRLRVTDDWGATAVSSALLRVLDRPRARVSLVWSPATAGAATAFSAADSLDPDGRIERLDWDFDGDGRTDAVTWSPATKAWWTYARAGDHVATVTVTDGDGLQARASVTVPVR